MRAAGFVTIKRQIEHLVRFGALALTLALFNCGTGRDRLHASAPRVDSTGANYISYTFAAPLTLATSFKKPLGTSVGALVTPANHHGALASTPTTGLCVDCLLLCPAITATTAVLCTIRHQRIPLHCGRTGRTPRHQRHALVSAAAAAATDHELHVHLHPHAPHVPSLLRPAGLSQAHIVIAACNAALQYMYCTVQCAFAC